VNSARIAGEIEDLLRQDGPQITEDLRTRLMVSSKARFDAAVYILIEEGKVQRFTEGSDPALRLLGDARPVYEGPYVFVRKLRTRVAVANGAGS
jgi:hypothetical protein